MAKVLIVGGGFGGVVVAESLAKKLGDEHEITLLSRSRQFLFYPDSDVEPFVQSPRRRKFVEG